MARSHLYRLSVALLVWTPFNIGPLDQAGIAWAEAPPPTVAWTECRSGNIEKTIAACTQIISGASDTADKLAEAHELRGNAYFNRRMYEAAIADYSKAIELSPAVSQPRYWRAHARWTLGSRPQALEDLGTTLALNPKHMGARQTRGWMRRETGDLEGSIADLTALIAMDPNSASAYRDRGLSYLRQGDTSKALADTEKAVALAPSDGYAFVFRGRVLEAVSRQADAKADYEKTLTLTNYGAWDTTLHDVARARLAALAGEDDWATCRGKEPDLGIAACNRIVSIPSDTHSALSSAYVERARHYRDKQDSERAFADYAMALQLNPTNAWAYFQRGFMHLMKGMNDQAIADNTAAIRLDPDNISAFYNRGIAYTTKNQCGQAIMDYSEVLRRQPANIAALYWRGDCLAKQKKPDKAADDFRAALAAKPGPGTWESDHQKRAKAALDALKGARAAGKRVALLIGVSAYPESPLRNPTNDVEAVAKSLRAIGFETTVLTNATYEAVRTSLSAFTATAAKADVAVIHFAGHGIEFEGENYVLPSDAKLNGASDLALQAVSLTTLQNAVSGASFLRLIILDACRTNPFRARLMRSGSSTRGAQVGLAAVEPEGNVLVAFSAKAGTVAQDGARDLSPFAEALVKHVGTPGLDIRLMFGRVRDEVVKSTRQGDQPSQTPYLYGSLGGEAIMLSSAN